MTAKLSKPMEEGLKILLEKSKKSETEYFIVTGVKEKTLWALKERKFVEHSSKMLGIIYCDTWKLTYEGYSVAEELVGDTVNEFQ